MNEFGVDSSVLLTEAMLARAQASPVELSEREIRSEAVFNLRDYKALERQKYGEAPKLSLVNLIDNCSPPLKLRYIVDNVYGEGVDPPDEGSFEGCSKCRADMGKGIGCEYTALCDCLEFANVNEHNLKSEEQWAQYRNKDEEGTAGLPKLFPYRRTMAGGWDKMVGPLPFIVKQTNDKNANGAKPGPRLRVPQDR
jgi:[histone H3]-lysine9 N-trimethyltransferase SUV39H